jgi:hypothetical protein
MPNDLIPHYTRHAFDIVFDPTNIKYELVNGEVWCKYELPLDELSNRVARLYMVQEGHLSISQHLRRLDEGSWGRVMENTGNRPTLRAIAQELAEDAVAQMLHGTGVAIENRWGVNYLYVSKKPRPE